MSRRLETGPTNITSDRNITLLRDLPKQEGKRPICFHTLIVYFNLDLVTGLEIAVDCFVTVSLEQLVPRADHMDPVLAYKNLRWHSLDRRGRNHLSDGLHRKLDLVSSTHCGKAKAEDDYCYEVTYSVHNIRVFERALACRRTKPTPPFGRSLSNRRLDLRPCGEINLRVLFGIAPRTL